MDPRAANMAVAVWNGCARDARRHACQWRPADRWRQGSKDVSELVPDAGRFYVSLLSRSLVALFLVQGCMVLLKNCETYYY